MAAGVLGVTALMSLNRSPTANSNIQGMPLGVVVLGAIVLATDTLVRRTRFGRHLFAIGGNAEAARRAGIDVDRVRVAVFTLAATLAACGGILSASRLYSVNQSSGAGVDVLLSAMAAPVIGGTSLFGGRGSAWSALLGALVIGAISNGMDLLALAASIKFMIYRASVTGGGDGGCPGSPFTRGGDRRGSATRCAEPAGPGAGARPAHAA